MNSKPLSYDARKVLMEYLPYMTRMKLSRRCPSLKTIEKLVPLRLNNVTLDVRFTLDNTEFWLEVVRKCPVGVPVPDCFRHGFDTALDTLDQHGVPDIEDRNSWTPGDIVRRNHIAEEAEDPIADLEQQIEEIADEQTEDGQYVNDMDYIEMLEIQLQAFKNRRDNILSPYQLVYRLKVTQEGQQPQFFYSDVDMKYSAKSKQLAEFLFGGRPVPISVKELTIEDGDRTIRMPPGPIFKIRRLSLSNLLHNNINAASALHDSSFPLERLSVIINVLMGRSIIGFIMGNENPALTIRGLDEDDVSYEELIEIIIQLRARNRDICLRLLFDEAPDFLERFDDIERQFQADRIDNYLRVPMEGDLYLRIDFERAVPFAVRLTIVRITM
ncbi:hypothetical protein CAEBREN_16001 [Caenorhabditis brenneri]|uniref:F-box domain-containing protein n=1 Tax=Caenorhabditis brenneri TaxID=135651 RepID=G0N7W5_CAEBE|nr:hypothetical protein CAEBREN_16001 [Caenorhabditis brenneri]